MIKKNSYSTRQKTLILSVIFVFVWLQPIRAQTIREYVVRKIHQPVTIDGKLDEWNGAEWTEKFVRYADGGQAGLPTRAKILWDENFLYIGFMCTDPDVWATMTERDSHLWNEEVVEIFCDPDGDGNNYFELQVNPLETVLDLYLDKAYYRGGQAHFEWDMKNFCAAVHVDGNINDQDKPDNQWTCEAAVPFAEMAFLAPDVDLPPKHDDRWRLLLARYDYERSGDGTVEITAWNQTDSRGFHVPEKFGRIIFSAEPVHVPTYGQIKTNTPSCIELLGSYPNPFNASATIRYTVTAPVFVKLILSDIYGRQVSTLADGFHHPGRYQKRWHGVDKMSGPVASGVYILRLESGTGLEMTKMVLCR